MFKFAFQNVVNELFGPTGSRDIAKQLSFETNFENSKIRDSVPTF